MQGEDYGRLFKLDEIADSLHRNVLCLGRLNSSSSNDIPIREEQSRYVSRRHCSLERDVCRKRWIIRDGQWDAQHSQWCESLNGTFIASQSVSTDGLHINPGDIISVGDVKLRVEGY
jgi:pSer/pThr/pTyr-binding forkhead associated (FHA) protein